MLDLREGHAGPSAVGRASPGTAYPIAYPIRPLVSCVLCVLDTIPKHASTGEFIRALFGKDEVMGSIPIDGSMKKP